MPALLNHLRLTVSDIEAAAGFYGPLMRCLDFTPTDRDDGGLAWGIDDGSGRMQWLIVTPAPARLRGHSHQYLAPGLHPVAFNARDRAHVDRVHDVLVGLGAEILEAPSEYDDEPDH